jgi:phospholipid N-methyltransferase
VGEHADLLGAFLRDPVATGAIAPSSRLLARRMVEGLDLAAARTVVEAGPGTGAFTGTILEATGDDACVVAVEVNGRLAARLEARFPGLHVVHDSVEHLPRHLAALGRPQADAVLCGLPWAVFGPKAQERLLEGIRRGLRQGGVFVTFGYVHCALLPWTRHFHRLLARDFVDLTASPVVWRNLPPAIVYRCRKPTDHEGGRDGEERRQEEGPQAQERDRQSLARAEGGARRRRTRVGRPRGAKGRQEGGEAGPEGRDPGCRDGDGRPGRVRRRVV